jgi:hypothetical protein
MIFINIYINIYIYIYIYIYMLVSTCLESYKIAIHLIMRVTNIKSLSFNLYSLIILVGQTHVRRIVSLNNICHGVKRKKKYIM